MVTFGKCLYLQQKCLRHKDFKITPDVSTNMSEAKQKLLELELTGKFVFHGSDADVSEFDPRQAHNNIEGRQIPDGDPAVFASSIVDYAIFMAIVNKTNCPDGYRAQASTHAGSITFRAEEKALNQLKDTSSGFVYVFDKNNFKRREVGSFEYVSSSQVKPLERIRVTKDDLPKVEIY